MNACQHPLSCMYYLNPTQEWGLEGQSSLVHKRIQTDSATVLHLITSAFVWKLGYRIEMVLIYIYTIYIYILYMVMLLYVACTSHRKHWIWVGIMCSVCLCEAIHHTSYPRTLGWHLHYLTCTNKNLAPMHLWLECTLWSFTRINSRNSMLAKCKF